MRKQSCLGEHGVVDGRQFESVLIENRQEWIKIRLAQANSFDFDRQSLALLVLMR